MSVKKVQWRLERLPSKDTGDDRLAREFEYKICEEWKKKKEGKRRKKILFYYILSFNQYSY